MEGGPDGGGPQGGADLTSADLEEADLRVATLEGALLRGAAIGGALMEGATGLRSLAPVPETGSFIAWKKLANDTIAKLRIPEDAMRVGSYVGRKCRASKVEVLEGEGVSDRDVSVVYSPGRILEVQDYNPDPQVVCTTGLHFFMTEQEAQQYQL